MTVQSPAGPAAAAAVRIGPGVPGFTRTRWALFASGFTIFGLLYYVQSLLPVFSEELGVSPAQSSLALSSTTGVMAFALLFAGAISDVVGRKTIMTISLLSSSLLTLAMAFVPGWSGVLAIRFLMGISLCGVQSVTMAYLAEEVEPKVLGATLGLFISGSALGGMFGRMFASILADQAGWRVAVAVMGVAGLIATIYFRAALPPSRHFVPRAPGAERLVAEFKTIVRDTVQLRLFIVGFAVMSCFVTTYNFITFRLTEPPFDLSQTVVGFIFLIYLFGSAGATLAGILASRHGHNRVLWGLVFVMVTGVLITLSDHLFVALIGLSVLTFGLFSSHSVASGWVSMRARQSKALAASLYLFAYYQGGSIIGASGGLFWEAGGWASVVTLVVSIGCFGGLVALSLIRCTPRETTGDSTDGLSGG